MSIFVLKIVLYKIFQSVTLLHNAGLIATADSSLNRQMAKTMPKPNIWINFWKNKELDYNLCLVTCSLPSSREKAPVLLIIMTFCSETVETRWDESLCFSQFLSFNASLRTSKKTHQKLELWRIFLVIMSHTARW